ncbi:MAG: polysaccharide deacetylase family protein [Ardenticatenaceae bacterium]|nr:polysaccharide deacetylase family protein [Ardenticatenaceae bacterium]
MKREKRRIQFTTINRIFRRWPYFLGVSMVAAWLFVACSPTAPSAGGAESIVIGGVLREVTAVPESMVLIHPLSTFTPIPTITPEGDAVAQLSPPTVTASPTLIPTATHTPTPTFTPSPMPTPNPPVYLTAPLPDLPLILPSPTVSRSVRVPILMYHYISVPPDDADQYRINLSVEPDDFRSQMAFLKADGYETVDMYDMIEAIVNGIPLPEKPIILTFDDGYRDNYTNAYPILTEFGFKGTFFIATEFVDRGYEPYMTWPMIEEMAAAGHRFESHTKTHPDLILLDRAGLIWQILGSQETLAAHIGYKPQFFSYPSGSYNEDTIEILQELNFWGAVTTQGGAWHGFYNRYEWPRIRVSHSTSIGRLQRALLPLPPPTPVVIETPTP